MAEEFLRLTAQDRREVLAVAADRCERPAHLLEKDVWVVWALGDRTGDEIVARLGVLDEPAGADDFFALDQRKVGVKQLERHAEAKVGGEFDGRGEQTDGGSVLGVDARLGASPATAWGTRSLTCSTVA